MINAGRLDRLINIRQPVSTARSTDGEPIQTWTTVLENIWCDVRPITAREFFRSDNRYAEADTMFTLRYTSVINSTMRVILDSNEYWIESVIDVSYEHRELQILGKRIV